MWAFCVVLYEALLGHVPFTDTNYHRLLRRIIDEPIPTFSRVGIQDDALWAIIAKGLRKDPSERFENMRSLGVNLARWLLDMGITEDAGNGSLRATWLQVSTTDARGPLTSYVDSVETLTSVPCEPPTRILLDATLRRRYRISRLVWYSAIFFGSILLTLVAKSWIRKSNDQRDVPGATALAVATATTAHPSTVSTIEHADSAAEPAIAARPLSQTTSSGALAATSGAATPTAAILRPSRPGAQRSLALTPQKSAANQVHSAAIVNRATPAKLDIKTDF
jgi:serine/threonine-protein kinase